MSKQANEIRNSGYNSNEVIDFADAKLSEVKNTIKIMQTGAKVALDCEILPASWMKLKLQDGSIQLGSDLGKAVFSHYFPSEWRMSA